ncbi:MAG: serine/threonine-protein kinase, partial [Myxococcota bacterium]
MTRDDARTSSLGLDSFEMELQGLIMHEQALDDHARHFPGELGHRFELGASLGKGGFGSVVEVRDRDAGTTWAMKLIQIHGSSPEQRARIKREFRAGRRLDHANVVQTQELFETDTVWAFTMERLDRSLRDHLKEEGPLPLDQALHIALELLRGLDFIHSERVVHRDLKPGNILINTPDPQKGIPAVAKLADFGIARFGELGEGPSLWSVVGTPAYMPPEALNEGRFDPRGDLYALGLIVVEMLTGRHPLGASNNQDWAWVQSNHHPERPEGLPNAVWTLLEALLHKQPEERPRTAREVYEAWAPLSPNHATPSPLRGGIYLASPALVGREHECEQARTWLEQRFSHSTRPLVLWITGSAGVGKSRLLRSFLPQTDAITILHGKGRRQARHPFAALHNILRQLEAVTP